MVFVFFNDTATTEIYTLSLHDALPIFRLGASPRATLQLLRASRAYAALAGRDYVSPDDVAALGVAVLAHRVLRSEEHTSELQSRQYLVCRLLLEKKKQPRTSTPTNISS